MRHIRPLAMLVLLCAVQQLAAQGGVRLNAYGGYTFADKFNFDGYPGYDQAKFDESEHFGFGLEVEFRPLTSIEIYYQWQPTSAQLLGALDAYQTDVTISYLMIGGMRYTGNDRVKGFGGLLLGAGFFNSEDVDATKFGIGGRLGLLITPNPKVGIRIGAQLLSAVQGAGGGFYFGTGGAGAGVSTYSSIYQFGLFGGISLSLGSGSAPARSSVPAPAPAQAPPPPQNVPPPPPAPPPPAPR